MPGTQMQEDMYGWLYPPAMYPPYHHHPMAPPMEGTLRRGGMHSSKECDIQQSSLHLQ